MTRSCAECFAEAGGRRTCALRPPPLERRARWKGAGCQKEWAGGQSWKREALEPGRCRRGLHPTPHDPPPTRPSHTPRRPRWRLGALGMGTRWSSHMSGGSMTYAWVVPTRGGDPRSPGSGPSRGQPNRRAVRTRLADPRTREPFGDPGPFPTAGNREFRSDPRDPWSVCGCDYTRCSFLPKRAAPRERRAAPPLEEESAMGKSGIEQGVGGWANRSLGPGAWRLRARPVPRPCTTPPRPDRPMRPPLEARCVTLAGVLHMSGLDSCWSTDMSGRVRMMRA